MNNTMVVLMNCKINPIIKVAIKTLLLGCSLFIYIQK